MRSAQQSRRTPQGPPTCHSKDNPAVEVIPFPKEELLGVLDEREVVAIDGQVVWDDALPARNVSERMNRDDIVPHLAGLHARGARVVPIEPFVVNEPEQRSSDLLAGAARGQGHKELLLQVIRPLREAHLDVALENDEEHGQYEIAWEHIVST